MDAPPKPSKIKEEEPVINLVQGIMPDSKNEYFVALALDKLNLEYRFQVPLGQIGIRGSQVIDFIVYSGGGALAIFVQGEYWHDKKSESEDTLKHAAAERYYGRGNVIDLMGEETDTVDKAYQAVRSKVL